MRSDFSFFNMGKQSRRCRQRSTLASSMQMTDAEWRAFIDALDQFKRDGTGVDDELIQQFPIYHGKAPAGHPYPQAFTEGATVIDDVRADAERIFREVYSMCLSGYALDQRVRERMFEWDADRA